MYIFVRRWNLIFEKVPTIRLDNRLNSGTRSLILSISNNEFKNPSSYINANLKTWRTVPMSFMLDSKYINERPLFVAFTAYHSFSNPFSIQTINEPLICRLLNCQFLQLSALPQRTERHPHGIE